MVAYRKQKFVTPKEYLRREHEAAMKSEYYDGVVVGMAGASPEHNAVLFDLAVSLGSQLRESNCQGFVSDLRVHVPECNRYYYPDMTVICGEAEYETIDGIRSLLNPTALIEVLSDSTERTDREDKLDCYRTLASLAVYVLVTQDRPRVEAYIRQADGSWRYDSVTGHEAVLSLEAVHADLRLAEIYARTVVPELFLRADASSVLNRNSDTNEVDS